jgi:ABC-type histidine transport system ATPase subunit
MNPKLIVPYIEELIHLVTREKAGTLYADDKKKLDKIRAQLTQFFFRVEE